MSAYCHVRKILANLSEKGLARFITFCAAICVCAASCKHHDVDFKNVADTRSRLAAIIEAVREQVYFEQRPLPDLSSMGELRSWLLEGEHVIPFSSKDSFGREFIVHHRADAPEEFMIYSCGKNGIDEKGQGDDIVTVDYIKQLRRYLLSPVVQRKCMP